ncbi:MAG: UDP-glucose/GDP-mannose dehydrogenase family protein [Verrucomicrobia bacterium]|nr:UDP-glucose/GDP-mannose dehydrogenase family protein [Verrucomicrobiota bacterium]
MENQKITVIGIGRLGICLALCLEKAGYDVLGVDVSPAYIAEVNSKTFSSLEPSVNDYLRSSKNFKATTSIPEGVAFSDLIFLVVPTNTAPGIESYDHTILSDVLAKIDECAPSNKHVVISSTVFPGYIAKTARPLLKNCPNATVSYNPEFIAQGNIIHGMRYPDMVLIGEGSKEAGQLLESIYTKLCANTPHIARMSPESAEIAKLTVNCFVTAKIAFANLIGDIADETPNADKNAILEAVGKDQRIGSKNLMPGYGFGGPCFPRDNRALGNYATLIGIEPLLFRATDEVNAMHTAYQAKKLIEQNLDKYVFEDVCYKPNCPVPIIEHSQKLAIAKTLADQGKEVTILDSENVISKVRQEYKNIFNYASKYLSA